MLVHVNWYPRENSEDLFSKQVSGWLSDLGDFDLFVSTFYVRECFRNDPKVIYIFNTKYKPHFDKVTLEDLRDRLNPNTCNLLLELYALI